MPLPREFGGPDISGFCDPDMNKNRRKKKKNRQKTRSNCAGKPDATIEPDNICNIDNEITEQITEMEKDTGKSAMEGQLPRINSKFTSQKEAFTSETEAEAMMGSEAGKQHVEEITAGKLEEGMMDRGKSAIHEQEMAMEERGKSVSQDDWKTVNCKKNRKKTTSGGAGKPEPKIELEIPCNIGNKVREQMTEIQDICKSDMEAEALMGLETDEQHEELTAGKSQEGMMGRCKSAIQEQEMAMEERHKSAMQDDWETAEIFASYRYDWESTWGGLCDFFENKTTVSSMHFTHYTPGRIPIYGAGPETTLQIFSIKITLKESAEFPLPVYGVVAARDYVDHNRNFLFLRQRFDSKELTKEDPFLPLIGPSRAVLCTEPVDFEIQLKVKGTTKSQDRVLITARQCLMSGSYNNFSTIFLENRFCIAEISFEKLQSSVQATMLGVRVIQVDTWPFEFGGRVACYSPIRQGMYTDSKGDLYEVVLLDYKGTEMPVGLDGYLHLSRHVVSVELHRLQSSLLNYEESLQVVIQAYSPSGNIAEQSHVNFQPKLCNISHGDCMLGGSKLEITVAWSCLASKESMALEGYVDGLE